MRLRRTRNVGGSHLLNSRFHGRVCTLVRIFLIFVAGACLCRKAAGASLDEEKVAPDRTDFRTELKEVWAAAASGDYATALKILKPLADVGNPRAEDDLGGFYARGWG